MHPGTSTLGYPGTHRSDAEECDDAHSPFFKDGELVLKVVQEEDGVQGVVDHATEPFVPPHLHRDSTITVHKRGERQDVAITGYILVTCSGYTCDCEDREANPLSWSPSFLASRRETRSGHREERPFR